ncbi:MAG: response regulator [Desulfosarcina sp.]|nr:response regulator [Desulfosarcina sp.]MBC2744805.1 response regulator [Desulfosarcina sp.]MBC2767713.1 response regulator [Desulfosarcina sp.]
MNNGIRVLLVDDEEKFVKNMARLLRFREFMVETALDGFKALAAIEEDEGFDVVVLDVKMPGMDGITTLGKIKKHSPETEVIMLTGHATVESGIQAIREGAFDYLMKPCDIEELAEKIKEACEVERIRRRPVLWPRNLVKEITWPSFVKLYANDPIVKALEVFQRDKGMSSKESLYVLDAEDRFEGIVTRRDLLTAAQKEHPERSLTWHDLADNPEQLPRIILADILQPDYPIATNPEENLTEAARRMIDNNVRCMPVVEGEKVIGFIRLLDIFQYVEHEIE